mmetsp:Transcript_27237/g.44386  ORF Transcript_27237/g.44386 Transcript_27237/m.44386 type:complete len:265 (-) Transcript_27237:392-1186(-)|eukprot:CAMPEP_0184650014 /NCGR_PEP_ID=MMETSP0308-20130426/7486_1 /TAXON_ID=38269 /ORGANISM="Gloeochaete witrockiana, Strain SAG 46.84" /LENGTH=264 /DNA_ID=CAMNT_0027083217 /DNA_START=98 /DNA_END=892 /DNA_ORIENTATION=-
MTTSSVDMKLVESLDTRSSSDSTNVSGTINSSSAAPESPVLWRPQNAFVLFSNDFRDELHSNQPHLTNCQVSILLGHLWRELDPATKNIYIERAIKSREEFKRQHPDHKFQPKVRNKRKRADSSYKTPREHFDAGAGPSKAPMTTGIVIGHSGVVSEFPEVVVDANGHEYLLVKETWPPAYRPAHESFVVPDELLYHGFFLHRFKLESGSNILRVTGVPPVDPTGQTGPAIGIISGEALQPSHHSPPGRPSGPISDQADKALYG